MPREGGHEVVHVGARRLLVQLKPVHEEADQRAARGTLGHGLPENGAGPVDPEVLGLLQVEGDDLALELAPFEPVFPQS